MRLGLHVPNFTFPNGPSALGDDLVRIAQGAEQAGFDRVSVMDHFFQIRFVGAPEQEMLEAYTTLGFIAAHTQRIKLLTLVTGVVYRDPGLLAKAVTTLDVLSGGRAMLGIGAAWNEEEALGLGLFFPPTKERFERLEEALQICLKMWSGDESGFNGKHYHLERTLNSPQALSRPHPPVLIGGGGEKKTLRLVAKYAQACNIGGTEGKHKLEVLAEHCEREGRNYDEIEKTALFNFDVGEKGENVNQIIDALGKLSEDGFDVAHGSINDPAAIRSIELMGSDVIPVVAKLGRGEIGASVT